MGELRRYARAEGAHPRIVQDTGHAATWRAAVPAASAAGIAAETAALKAGIAAETAALHSVIG